MPKITVSRKLTSLCRTRPCMIITTLHEDGTVNAGTFGAYTNVGPQEIGVAIGKGSHTYQNIKRSGEFVINVPSIDIAQALETCALPLAPSESELGRAGLSTAPAEKIAVPVIAECVANIECTYSKELDIGPHSFVVGKAVMGHVEEDLLDVDGGLDPRKARVPYGVRYPDPIYAVLGELTEVRKA